MGTTISGVVGTHSGQMLSGQIISGAGNELYVEFGATATATLVESYGGLFTETGGGASGTLVGSHGLLDVGFESIVYNSVVSGGLITVQGLAAAVATTIEAGGLLQISAFATGYQTVLSSGGSEDILSGGKDGQVVVGGQPGAGGTVSVYAGGTLEAGTVLNGGTLVAAAGGVTSGVVTIYAGGTLSGTFGGTAPVDIHLLSGAVTKDLLLESGAVLTVFPGAQDSNTVIQSGGVLIDSGAVIAEDVESGGLLRVAAGGTAMGTEVRSGGYLVVQSGGTAGVNAEPGANVIVSSGGVISDLNVVTINAGGGSTVSDAPGLTVMSGGLVLHGGIANQGSLTVVSGGAIGLVEIGSGGKLAGGLVTGVQAVETPNGALQDLPLDNSFALQQTLSLPTSGSPTGGVTPDRLGLGNGVTVALSSGAVLSGANVLSGGRVLNSGTVDALTVALGGSLVISSGGVGLDDVVLSGGSETVLPGGSEAMSVSFGGVVSRFSTTSEAPVHPFTRVTVTDPNPGALETVTVTQTGSGVLNGGVLSGLGLGLGGIFTVRGTAAAVTSALEAAVFTPASASPAISSTTLFTLTDQSSASPVVFQGGTVAVTDVDQYHIVSNVPLYGGLISGTAGPDLISAAGWNNVISGLGGDDVIDAGRGGASVFALDGNAQIALHGWGNLVSGGSGDKTISGSQGNTRVMVGNGGAAFSLGGYGNFIATGLLGSGSTIDAGDGNETVSVSGGSGAITARGYGNVISAGVFQGSIDAGAGNARVAVGGGVAYLTARGWGDVFTLGDGVFDLGGFDGGVTVQLDWTSAAGATDELHLRGSPGDTYTLVDNVLCCTGKHAPVYVTLQHQPAVGLQLTPDGFGGAFLTLLGTHGGAAPGYNVVSPSGVLQPVPTPAPTNSPRIPIYKGHPPQTVPTVPAADAIDLTFHTYGESLIDPGNNNDFAVTGNVDGATVVLGSGQDFTSLTGDSEHVTFGNGNDFIKIVGARAVVTVGNGSNTVVTSGYDETVTVGGGINLVEIDGSGGGTIHLGSGFTDLILQGYGNTVTGGTGGAYIDGSQFGLFSGSRFEVTGLGADGGMDIEQFSILPGNQLDLSQILPTLTASNTDLAKFVDVYNYDKSDTVVSVDLSGQGHFTKVAILGGANAGSLSDLLAKNQIIL